MCRRAAPPVHRGGTSTLPPGPHHTGWKTPVPSPLREGLSAQPAVATHPTLPSLSLLAMVLELSRLH